MQRDAPPVLTDARAPNARVCCCGMQRDAPPVLTDARAQGEFLMTCGRHGRKICGVCNEVPGCGPGEYRAGCGPGPDKGTCSPCPAGTFKAHGGAHACTPCPPCPFKNQTRIGCHFSSPGVCTDACGANATCANPRFEYAVSCEAGAGLVCTPCHPPCPRDAPGGMTSCFGPGEHGRVCGPSAAPEPILADLPLFLGMRPSAGGAAGGTGASAAFAALCAACIQLLRTL